MSKVSKAPSECRALIADLVEERYPHLANARIGCLMSDEVKEHGSHVVAKIKVNNEADRLDGKPDATITLERSGWELLGMLPWEKQQARKRAVLESMLYSLLDLEKTDDQGRPLFERRDADWSVTGYRAMAERYGPDSLEVIEASRLKDEFGELLFGFMEPPAPQGDVTRRIMEEVAARVNAGALGPGVTATVNGRSGPMPAASSVVEDAFRALLSVGHAEDQARQAVESATAGGREFASVAELIDAIYTASKEEPDPPTLPPFTPGLKLFQCNRCGVNRTRDVPICPACNSPESALRVVNDALEVVKDEEWLAETAGPAKARKPRAKAEARA